MKKSLFKILKLQIYPFDVAISINQSDDDFKKEMKKFKIDLDDVIFELDQNSSCRGRTLMLFPSLRTILRINFWPDNNIKIGLLVHELFHVTDYILREVGIKLSDDSDESYAYLLQYLTEQVLKCTEQVNDKEVENIKHNKLNTGVSSRDD